MTSIEDEKICVIEKYYPEWTNERSDFQELLSTYIKSIKDIVSNDIKVDDKASDACPFVIIGSNIVLKDSYTNKLENLQIVSPFCDGNKFDVDSASYLSPMGRAFLLKKVHDDVKVETPMGIFQYKIEAIELPEDVFQFH
jgi:transcription elongation factor GreA